MNMLKAADALLKALQDGKLTGYVVDESDEEYALPATYWRGKSTADLTGAVFRPEEVMRAFPRTK